MLEKRKLRVDPAVRDSPFAKPRPIPPPLVPSDEPEPSFDHDEQSRLDQQESSPTISVHEKREPVFRVPEKIPLK